MTIEVVNTVSSFVIDELTGEGRSVRMVGRALPYRPFNLNGTQRVETTWYPGNPEATATVLGAAEEPTTITGYWKDKYLSSLVEVGGGNTTGTGGNQTTPLVVSGERIETCRRAAQVLDDIRRQGQLLRVTWDEQVREGHLTKFEQDWHNVHDLEWRMEFTWIGRGENAGSPTFTQELSVSDTADTLTQQNNALQAAAVPVFPISGLTNEDLTTRLADITRSVDQVSSTVTNLAANTLAPFDAARRTIAVTTALIDKTDSLIGALQARPARGFNASTPDINTLTMGQIIAAEAYVRGIISVARAMMRASVIRRQVLAASVQSELLGTYVAREGDDLRDVSFIFYRTPFEWRRLMTFNELLTAELAAGQFVLVPYIRRGGV